MHQDPALLGYLPLGRGGTLTRTLIFGLLDSCPIHRLPLLPEADVR